MKANRKTLVNGDTGTSDLATPGKKTTSTVIEPNSAGIKSTQN